MTASTSRRYCSSPVEGSSALARCIKPFCATSPPSATSRLGATCRVGKSYVTVGMARLQAVPRALPLAGAPRHVPAPRLPPARRAPFSLPRAALFPRPAFLGHPAAIRLSALRFLSETLLISSCATATTILPPGSAPWGQWGTRLGKLGSESHRHRRSDICLRSARHIQCGDRGPVQG